MKETRYELQNIVFGDGQAGSGNQLKKSQNFLRGYAQTSISVKKQKHFKNEETTALLAFAKEEDLLYKGEILTNDFIAEGA